MFESKLLKKNLATSGFTLIELLVVVAILGVIASIGVVAYGSYKVTAKRNSAENTMLQISLAQTEYYSDNSSYYTTGSGANCDADSDSSGEIATNLFINVASKIDFEMCIIPHGTGDYKIKAESTKDSCVIEWNNVDQKSVRTGCD